VTTLLNERLLDILKLTMKFYFKRSATVLPVLVLMIACNSPVENTAGQDTNELKTETIDYTKSTVEKTETIVLKDISLTEKTMIEGKKLSNAKQLDNEQIKLLSIEAIDTGAPGNDCTYHIIDTLFAGSDLKVLLIGRAYTEENIIWAAVYDKNNDLIDNKQIYYDNSEGALSIGSEISKNAITVKTLNDYAETDAGKQKTEIYFLNEANKFTKK